jgi:hypothetical protein
MPRVLPMFSVPQPRCRPRRLAGLTPRPNCGGFALIITILLMAFLVLIMVSFAALTRVETQIAANQQRLEKARQNALFGLQVAMGQLQKYAGPDQRVTARAELTATATNPYYTGVWDAAAAATAAGDTRTRTATLEAAGQLNPVAPSVWLVSGNETTPTAINHNSASSTMREPVTLVKATGIGTLGQVVVVPKVQITSSQVPGYSGPQPIGNYAYWVGDEGVKAKLSVVDPYTPRPAVANASSVTPTSLQTYYRGVSAQRFGLETVDDGTNAATLASTYNPTANTTDSATLLRDFKKIISYSTANFVGFDQATLRARFHDLTAYSNGLLTNTAAGGLRRDLSWHFAQPDATDGLDKTSLLGLDEQKLYAPGLYYSTSKVTNSINPKWQALKAYYNTPVTNGATSVVLPNNINTINGVTPMVVQARFFFGCRSTDAGTYLDTYVAFVLANPYNVALNVQPIRFKFSPRSVPGINITVKPGSQAAVTTAILGASPAPLSGSFLSPAFTLAPGKVKVLSLAAATAAGATDALLQDSLDINNAVSVQLGATPFIPDSVNKWSLTYVVNSSYTLTATDKATEDSALVANNANTAAAIARLWDCGFVGFPSMPGTHTSMANPWVAGGIISTLKMASENITTAEQIRWLLDFNTRIPGQGRPADPDNSPLYKALFWSTGSTFSSDLASGDPCWGTAVSDNLGKTPVMLFNLPRPPSGAAAGWPSIISLGQMQHANVGTRAWQPSYIIGNSYASLFTQRDQTVSITPKTVSSSYLRDDLYYDLSYLLNEALWDGYYFSSVPQLAGTFNPTTDTLPNSRYFTRTSSTGVRPTQSELTSGSYAAASRLLVNGAFNINSTSVQAWRALFTSFRGLSYNSETNLTGPFPRSPDQSGGSTDATTVTNQNAWSGFRNLTNTDINNLATQMVLQVRLRGPFRSLGDFVNRRLMSASADPNNLGLRGALQAAIDAAGLNGGFNDSVDTTAYSGTTLFPANVVGSRSAAAPGWLLQGDLLQGLGPILSARSDTFIIRTYGDSADPVSTANGITPPRVYCEAVVQRIPDYVDKTDAADAASLTTTNTQFGRRFIITQFRWLTESDL